MSNQAPDRFQEEIKLRLALRSNATLYILGNSRAEIGFNPESKALSQKNFTAFNLALAGSSLESSRRELEYLLQKGKTPTRIIVGLEYLDFLNTDRKIPKPTLKNRYPTPIIGIGNLIYFFH